MKIPQRILIFRQSSLGDVILTLPVLTQLKKSFPESQIDFFTKSAYSDVVRFQPELSDLYTFHDSASFYSQSKIIRAKRYDLFIDLQANLRSYYLRASLFKTKCLRYPKRRMAREMVVRRAALKLRVDHTIRAYLKPLVALGINITPLPPVLSVPPDAVAFADEFLRKRNLDSFSNLLAFCPGAKHHEKKWPSDNFREVAEKLLENPSVAVLVFGEKSDSFPLAVNISNKRLTTIMDFPIIQVAALMSKCRGALTNDSGLMHLANAVGAPAVAIFGPTNTRLGFGPSLPGSIVISDDVFCSPCSVHGQKPCRQPVKYCFTNITHIRVIDTVRKILK